MGKLAQKDKNTLTSFKWFLLWFTTLFFTMLLSYIGDHFETSFFLLSTKHTVVPIIMPVGLWVSLSFFKKSMHLSSCRKVLYILWRKIAVIVLSVISIITTLCFVLELLLFWGEKTI